MRSISSRIIVLFGLLLFIVCLGLGMVSYFASSRSLINVLNETMPKFASEASLTIDDSIQNQLNILGVMASSDSMEVFKEADSDYSDIVPLLSTETKRSEHRQMLLVDSNGRAISDEGKVSDMKDNTLFKTALSGISTVSDPKFSDKGSEIVMVYAVPVMVDNKVSGVLMAVRDGLELSQFAKRIEFGETGEAFIINKDGRTIAHADTELLKGIITTRTTDATSGATQTITSEGSGEIDVIATPTLSEGENSDLGFDNFSEVQKKMMEGSTGFEEYKYNGISKITGFAPISGYGWSIAVSVDKDEMMSELASLKRITVIISVLFLIVGFVVSYLIGKNISKPVAELTSQCITMSEGNFTTHFNEKYAKRRDEIGDLSRGFIRINTNVSEMVKHVASEAERVDQANSVTGDSMAKLTDEIQVMSSITEALSAKMQETSAMAEEMNATTTEIESAIESIAVKAQKGAEAAGEVSKRANGLRQTAEESQKSAQDIRLDNAAKLQEAIEQSRAVERINVLSDAILDISSRTNMLSLNATIEAVQAGESGRGFAVVAEEIRKLAENSKDTASEIQRVTQQVLESVHNLSVSSEQVLSFLNDKVAKDYDMLIETGEQYSHDAQMIDDMVTEFSATAQQLYSSVQNIMQAISDVSDAATEGASETMDMANKTSIVATRSNEVLEQAKAVKESAAKLIKSVSLFRM